MLLRAARRGQRSRWLEARSVRMTVFEVHGVRRAAFGWQRFVHFNDGVDFDCCNRKYTLIS